MLKTHVTDYQVPATQWRMPYSERSVSPSETHSCPLHNFITSHFSILQQRDETLPLFEFSIFELFHICEQHLSSLPFLGGFVLLDLWFYVCVLQIVVCFQGVRVTRSLVLCVCFVDRCLFLGGSCYSISIFICMFC